MWKVLQRAQELGVVPIAPADVVAEWWRGRSDIRETILAAIVVEPLEEGLARLAGECLAHVGGSATVDAIVMASAARRGGAVYTGDVGDLERLRAYFPAVRVFAA
jgi:hypothetical protein